MTFKVLDLFSGIGGFSLGLEMAGGFETVAFCEIDAHAQKVLKKHWPDVPVLDDVRAITSAGLKEKGLGKIDVLTGGFPCQDLSGAGQQRGIDGDRSGLWRELFRVMCDIQPEYMLFENVTGLLTGGNGLWFERILKDMAESGYILEWQCIPAASIGAPHLRDRVFAVAYPCEDGWRRIFAFADLKVKRDMGNDKRADWFGSGAGAWAEWQGKTKEEIFSKPVIAGKNDGVSAWMDRNSRLGNSIVPQIVCEIGKAINKYTEKGESYVRNAGFTGSNKS